ncbi:hypothetical protein CFC21_003098, partial [Triticum aestivum]
MALAATPSSGDQGRGALHLVFIPSAGNGPPAPLLPLHRLPREPRQRRHLRRDRAADGLGGRVGALRRPLRRLPRHPAHRLQPPAARRRHPRRHGPLRPEVGVPAPLRPPPRPAHRRRHATRVGPRHRRHSGFPGHPHSQEGAAPPVPHPLHLLRDHAVLPRLLPHLPRRRQRRPPRRRRRHPRHWTHPGRLPPERAAQPRQPLHQAVHRQRPRDRRSRRHSRQHVRRPGARGTRRPAGRQGRPRVPSGLRGRPAQVVGHGQGGGTRRRLFTHCLARRAAGAVGGVRGLRQPQRGGAGPDPRDRGRAGGERQPVSVGGEDDGGGPRRHGGAQGRAGRRVPGARAGARAGDQGVGGPGGGPAAPGRGAVPEPLRVELGDGVGGVRRADAGVADAGRPAADRQGDKERRVRAVGGALELGRRGGLAGPRRGDCGEGEGGDGRRGGLGEGQGDQPGGDQGRRRGRLQRPEHAGVPCHAQL